MPLSLFCIFHYSKKARESILSDLPSCGRCSMKDLARVVRKPVLIIIRDITLEKMITFKGEEKKFLVMDHSHCIGVDCKKGLIYDCEEKYALPLSLDSFVRCQFYGVDYCRQLLIH